MKECKSRIKNKPKKQYKKKHNRKRWDPDKKKQRWNLENQMKKMKKKETEWKIEKALISYTQKEERIAIYQDVKLNPQEFRLFFLFIYDKKYLLRKIKISFQNVVYFLFHIISYYNY